MKNIILTFLGGNIMFIRYLKNLIKFFTIVFVALLSFKTIVFSQEKNPDPGAVFSQTEFLGFALSGLSVNADAYNIDTLGPRVALRYEASNVLTPSVAIPASIAEIGDERAATVGFGNYDESLEGDDEESMLYANRHALSFGGVFNEFAPQTRLVYSLHAGSNRFGGNDRPRYVHGISDYTHYNRESDQEEATRNASTSWLWFENAGVRAGFESDETDYWQGADSDYVIGTANPDHYQLVNIPHTDWNFYWPIRTPILNNQITQDNKAIFEAYRNSGTGDRLFLTVDDAGNITARSAISSSSGLTADGRARAQELGLSLSF